MNSADPDIGRPAIFLSLEQGDKQFIGKGGRLGKALDKVSLTLAEGEFVAVLGPSGCGKTTLLQVLSGLEDLSGGRLMFRGRNISGLPPERRRFGLVFQSYALFPNLSVRENIGYGLHGSGWTRAGRGRRVEELISLTGLAGLENRCPGQLSGGQQQRVAVARALAPAPELLLLDEPLSALDARVRQTLGRELRAIQRQTGVTAVLVTHDQGEALALADRIILLNQGRVSQVGTPEELYARPRGRFGAEFIGHMNILALPELAGGRRLGLRYEDVEVASPTEATLRRPHTWVGRVERRTMMGPFHRLELLLNDFTTRIYADVPRSLGGNLFQEGDLVAVGLPEQRWYDLADETSHDPAN